jgi:hypothetical protein
MKPRTIYLTALSLIVVSEATLGVRWTREFTARRDAMLRPDERIAFSSKLGATEARIRAARDRLNAALDQPLEGTGGASINALSGQTTGPTAFSVRFREALKQPEFRAKLAEAQRARLPALYAPLLGALHLTPDQTAKFQQLLIDKQLARSDGTPTELIDPQIAAVLGDTGYAQYIHYEDTARLRAMTAKVAAALSTTATPLSPDTANQLVETWYAALPPETRGHPAGPTAEVGAGLGTDYLLPELPANSADLARGLLSAPQLAAFDRLIRAQAAQVQLRATSGS